MAAGGSRHPVRSAAGLAVTAALGLLAGLTVWPQGAERPARRSPPPSAPTAGEVGADRPIPRSRPLAGQRPATGPALARLEIPAIGVRAPLIALGLNPDRTLQVPARSDETGWWDGGPFPGRDGAAVVVGHVDSTRGPAVFFGLRRLRRGDEVRVLRPGAAPARFVVQRREEVAKDAFPTRRVYRAARGAELRLVTCSGRFDRRRGHYGANLIVYARRG